MTLPLPETTRWQPLRSGLVNIFKFDYEEFHYERGRLILKGNNGTGKSRVLALQLPFLLDASIDHHRLEPDGDRSKHMAWNLLMGRYQDRLGYTWLEFGRLDEGRPIYCTLGCGMQADSGDLKRWHFITRQRIGQELFLLTDQRSPLTRDRLQEALGSEGRLFRTAREYRSAVNAELFRLDPDRYDGLVDLLIALRQPQLSRQLDETHLSSVLSNAMPRIPEAVIGTVVDAFRSLESERIGLERLLDAALVVGQSLRPTTHLGEWLEPLSESDTTVRAVLEHIGFGEASGPLWVDTAGRYQAGPLRGVWQKPQAQHIGEGAREAARQQQMRVLEQQMQALSAELEIVAAAILQVQRRQVALLAEVNQMPTDRAVRRAWLSVKEMAGHEQLTTALDYRKWHKFVVERYQDGAWVRLTRRTHGTGSGGEKVIALTVPQFAAAAAYYRGASPHAPRLILLDEAFVGVDQNMRGKCMGLLEHFDLDFIMTSEREWGCFPDLAGVAIYHLTTHAGIDAIHLTRWTWNGVVRTRSDAPAAPMTAEQAVLDGGR